MKVSVRVPGVGETVLVGTQEAYNGSKVQPAIVTRVWSDDVINVTVFPDANVPFSITSVVRNTAEELETLRWRFVPEKTFKTYEQPA